MSESGAKPPTRFVPPTWQRWLNLPAALLLGALVLGPLTQVLARPAWDVVAIFVLALALAAGWRSLRASLTIDADTVVYRGITRTVIIPRAELLSYSDYSPGWASWVGDVPAIRWYEGSGQRTARLWLFALRPDVDQVGGGQLRRVREPLEQAMREAVRQAHLNRKRRGRA